MTCSFPFEVSFRFEVICSTRWCSPPFRRLLFHLLFYFLISISTGDPIVRIGYKNAIIIGMVLYIGCALFYPAAVPKYGFFLGALFVLASGSLSCRLPPTVRRPVGIARNRSRPVEPRAGLQLGRHHPGAVVGAIGQSFLRRRHHD